MQIDFNFRVSVTENDMVVEQDIVLETYLDGMHNDDKMEMAIQCIPLFMNGINTVVVKFFSSGNLIITKLGRV